MALFGVASVACASARVAFVYRMGLTLVVSAGVALTRALLAMLFLSARAVSTGAPLADESEVAGVR